MKRLKHHSGAPVTVSTCDLRVRPGHLRGRAGAGLLQMIKYLFFDRLQRIINQCIWIRYYTYSKIKNIRNKARRSNIDK